jgi:hypothetical protein
VKLFQQAFDTSRSSGWLGSSPSGSGSGSYPPLNVFRQGDGIVVNAEVPWVRKSDLQLEIKGRTIRIATRRKSSAHRRERLAGITSRQSWGRRDTGVLIQIVAAFSLRSTRYTGSYADCLQHPLLVWSDPRRLVRASGSLRMKGRCASNEARRGEYVRF